MIKKEMAEMVEMAGRTPHPANQEPPKTAELPLPAAEAAERTADPAAAAH